MHGNINFSRFVCPEAFSRSWNIEKNSGELQKNKIKKRKIKIKKNKNENTQKKIGFFYFIILS